MRGFHKFYKGIRGLRELGLASGNSSGISGDSSDSGEMREAGAPWTLPSTRAWGQDDGSSHKLPQIILDVFTRLIRAPCFADSDRQR